ncbi:MAG: pyruvate kinase [Cyanobacteria bacterium J06648_16]
MTSSLSSTTLLSQTSRLDDLSDPESLISVMQQLRQAVQTEGESIFSQWQPLIERPLFLESARNLAYYLALRQHDLRSLQTALMVWGLSSLGRIEARVMPNLEAVIATLGALCHKSPALLPARPPIGAFLRGNALLNYHTQSLFGPSQHQRQVRIMVTLPTLAAEDYDWVEQLLQAGTDCVRINCAHDSADQWAAMIAHVRRASEQLNHPCKVMMDLGGPKPRTGQLCFADPKQQRLSCGGTLLLTRAEPIPDDRYELQASCTLPEVLDALQIGDAVWIDDGKVGAVVEALTPAGVLLRITHAPGKGKKLKADKGLNFPSRALKMSPLTAKDRQDLSFVVRHADIVGYSFVQNAIDIVLLQEELHSQGTRSPSELAIVAKIETPEAVHHLPELIVNAAGRQPFGVMIARGDLAVEIGYQRLAEMQEEILWICEAAHVPVIWATQVLENLVKTGTPSRAEMTDAAMSERAECVMLNKGPYITDAVKILDDVLTRMQAHQLKKTPQLRALQAWQPFILER